MQISSESQVCLLSSTRIYPLSSLTRSSFQRPASQNLRIYFVTTQMGQMDTVLLKCGGPRVLKGVQEFCPCSWATAHVFWYQASSTLQFWVELAAFLLFCFQWIGPIAGKLKSHGQGQWGCDLLHPAAEPQFLGPILCAQEKVYRWRP